MKEPCLKTRTFFLKGSSNQFEWVLGLYDQALSLKAETKAKKQAKEVIKLDRWYQNELPRTLHTRLEDGTHLTYEEMVQTMKWKLARGKFRPNLVNLIQMNSQADVVKYTKEAFSTLGKKGDLQAAVNILCNMKGVGPATASAVLAAGVVPFDSTFKQHSSKILTLVYRS